MKGVLVEMAQERNERSDVTFEIVSHLGVLTEKKDGWTKELNLVSWNGGNPPKFDIRDWSPDHKKMNRGITLFEPEIRKVAKLYQEFSNAKTVAESKDKSNAAAEAGIRAGEEQRAREVEREREAELERAERERGAELERAERDAELERQAELEKADSEKDLAGVMAEAAGSEFASEGAAAPF